MIGDTSDLQGVPVDISSLYSFFTSPVGGNWYDEEIDILTNPTQTELLDTIDKIREANYDYVITLFSGHGNEAGGGTVLRINGEGETIDIDDLMHLSQRQLSIFDCCRSCVNDNFIEAGTTILSMSRDPIRQAYENQIQDCIPQEIILFACDEDEKAMETSEGGQYLQHLLYAVQLALEDSDSPFVSVDYAHRRAAALMRRANRFLPQCPHPQILQPRCLPHHRLPLAINPYFWSRRQ